MSYIFKQQQWFFYHKLFWNVFFREKFWNVFLRKKFWNVFFEGAKLSIVLISFNQQLKYLLNIACSKNTF